MSENDEAIDEGDIEEEHVQLKDEEIADHKAEENEQEIIDMPLTYDIIQDCLSMPMRLNFGLEHCYVKLDLSERGVSSIDLIEKFSHLRFLDLNDNAISDISMLGNILYLLRISATNNQIVSVNQLKPLAYLQVLDLSNNKIVNEFNLSMPRLVKLNLNENLIDSLNTSMGPILCKDNLPTLERLELRGNRLLSTAGIEAMPHIREAYLAANMIKQLDGIDMLTGVVRLHLRDNQIQRLDSFSANLVSLEYLNLRGNRVKRIKEIKKLSCLPNLKFFICSDNPVAEHEEYRILTIGHLENLQKLDKDVISPEERQEAMEAKQARAMEAEGEEEMSEIEGEEDKDNTNEDAEQEDDIGNEEDEEEEEN